MHVSYAVILTPIIMKTTSILRLAAASVALSISAHAAEVFSVTTTGTYPTAPSAVFNAATGDDPSTTGLVQVAGVDYTITADDITNGTATIGSGVSAVVYSVPVDATVGDTLEAVETGTYPYNIYGTTDTGNGAAWGAAIQTNFDGVTVVEPGGQKTQGGSNTTTYFGPRFYTGVNRASAGQLGAGVTFNGGNGYRIRCNNITDALVNGTPQVGTAQVGQVGDPDYAPASENYAAATTGLGGVSPSVAAIFMFDADTASLSGEDDNLIFGDADTLVGQLATPNTMLTRASSASYRAMVKADGQYYAGTLKAIDTTALTGANQSQLDTFTENAASATWTLMPGIDTGAANGVGAQNLTVDTSESATTVPGYALTNITQVGFLIAATAEISTGGWNYGVRSFTAQATPASAPDPIEWSQDFTSAGTILGDLSGLSGYGHAYTWWKSGAGLANGGSVADTTNNQATLSITENGNNGQVYLSMVGPGTTDLNGQGGNARRVRPVSHDTTWEIDLLAFKTAGINGAADIMLTTRGLDGYVKSTINPNGQIKFTTWMSDFTHTNFDDFKGPSSLRNSNGQPNANNPAIVIVDGGTVDSTSSDPVTITISGTAEGTVVLNGAGDAVESVTMTNFGSGYTAAPTVTWTGMSVDPTVSFNYNSGNVNGNPTLVNGSIVNFPVKIVEVGEDIFPQPNGNKNWNVFADGQILTFVQSYDSFDDSLSYYISFTDKATSEVTGPLFLATLTAEDDSPGGHGFFDVITGSRYTTPNNKDAIQIHLKRYGSAPLPGVTTIGINSVSVATIDDDRDGVINRNDAFPTDPFESVDSDLDGVGDNADTDAGYNDAFVAAINAAAQTAGDSTFSYFVNANADDYSYSTGGGAITQEAYDAAVDAKDAAEAAEATAIADLAALPTLSQIQSTLIDARVGSTMIEVSGGTADITMTLEETSDVSDWSNATTSQKTFEVSAPAGTSFYRFKMAD